MSEVRIMVANERRRLLWHGVLLFLVGLLTGLVEARFTNVRMGLAAHLEGIMNGIFLLAVGAVWLEVHLGPRCRASTYWMVLYGTYANWFFTSLAAYWGTGALSPVTAAGLQAQPWQEELVTLGFTSVGLAMIAVSGLLLWGLRFGARVV